MTGAVPISLAGVGYSFGRRQALTGIDLVLPARRRHGLAGPNGSGKTTLLRLMAGLLAPTAGTVNCLGFESPARHDAFKERVAYVTQEFSLYEELTVEENLKVPLERPGPWTIARIHQLFPRLAERRGNKGRQLSGGEQEMLAIARALILNPRLLILDEPSQGLAPLIVQEVFKVVTSARQEGISILLVEQNVRAATEIADRAYVLDDGRVVFSGAAGETRRPRPSFTRAS